MMAYSARAMERAIITIADSLEPKVRKLWAASVSGWQQDPSIQRALAAVNAGDYNKAMVEMMQSTMTDTGMRAFLNAASVQGAQATAQVLDVQSNAVRALKDRGLKDITNLSERGRRSALAVLSDAITSGAPIDQVANDLKAAIGLDERAMNALRNYRDGLKDSKLSRGEKARMVRAYQHQLFMNRARAIARTETMTALNEGQQAVYTNAQTLGLLPKNARKVWIVTKDDRLCPVCQGMAGQKVGINESFMKGTELVLTPPLHVNCRCTVGIA